MGYFCAPFQWNGTPFLADCVPREAPPTLPGGEERRGEEEEEERKRRGIKADF